MEHLPELDMRDPGFAQDFGHSLEETGFAIVVNHGVSAVLMSAAYDSSVALFASPVEMKRACETPENHRQTGYTSMHVERAVGATEGDIKEFWHVMRAERPTYPNRFPEGFTGNSVLYELFNALELCADRLLGALGAHLGYEKTHFQLMTKNGNSVLRLLHYPDVEGFPSAARACAHTDINLLTLLVSATGPGLEILTRTGAWIPVCNSPDAIIVNAGDMLALHTFGRIPSTKHRVVNPPGKDGGRYSMPFFVHPRADVPLVTAGSFLAHRLRENGVTEA